MFCQRIKLIPDIDVPINFIRGRIFGVLHVLFGKHGSCFAISFPNYDETINDLGSEILVACAEEEKLENLALKKELADYREYAKVSGISERENILYFKRVHPRNSVDNQIRSRIKHGFEYNKEEIKKKTKIVNAEIFKYPYIQLKSLSNKQRFNIFVKPIEYGGELSSYGLVTGRKD